MATAAQIAMSVVASSSDLLAAGKAALERYDWEEARLCFLEVVAEQAQPEVLELLTRACRWLNDDAGTIDAAERAFLLYTRRQDRLAAARVAAWLATDVLEFRGHDAVANGWLQRAHRLLEDQPTAPEHGWLAAVEAYLTLMGQNDPVAAIALADDALRVARTVDSNDIEMTALAIKGLALVTSGSVVAGMSLLDEASTAALHEEIEDPSLRSTILCALMDACDRVRDFERASQWSALIRDAAERWRLPAVTTVCRPHYAVVLAWRGRWPEAEAELEMAITEYNQIRPLMAVEGIVRLAELRLRQGKLDEAVALFTQVEHEGLAQIGRAEHALVTGDPTAACEIATRFLRRVPESDRVERAPGLELLGRAAIARGDLEQAAEAMSELRKAADAIGTRPLRAAAYYLDGLLAAARDDLDAARTAFEDAVDTYAAESAPFETARARVELGVVLAHQGTREAAEHEWATALSAFQALSAASEAARTMNLLRGTSEAVATHRERLLTFDLSVREREILRLIATGLSNPEIAESLVLSVRTVERHVSNIYDKLGASGRAARATATARAFQMGLVGAPRS